MAAIVVAAGAGTRFATPGEPRKQYRQLHGAPIVLWALHPFLRHPAVERVVVVLPPEDLAPLPSFLAGLPISPVAGGNERGDSVWNGIQELSGSGVETVLIHDGARPLVSRQLIDRVLGAAGEGGVVPALPVPDTLKEVGAAGRVLRTIDRSRYRRVQTPQLFPLDPLRRVYERARTEGFAATDDAALFERYGLPVVTVAGDETNLKVTTAIDFRLAELLAQPLPPPVPYRAADTVDTRPPR